jgi:hypothetical protein
VNNRHRKTLAAIFAEPVPASLAWAEIEALFVALGCSRIEGSGSRVRFAKDGRIASFHRPHPAREAKCYQVRAARDYLILIGVRP